MLYEPSLACTKLSGLALVASASTALPSDVLRDRNVQLLCIRYFCMFSAVAGTVSNHEARRMMSFILFIWTVLFLV